MLTLPAGLDNALRLAQSTALIVSSRTKLQKWTTLFEQLDYGEHHQQDPEYLLNWHKVRRPLRMFGWLGCWESARETNLSSSNSLQSNFQCLKMSFLGLFLFTEMFVLPFSMELLDGPLGQKLQIESFKFWAYSLCFSIASHLVRLSRERPVSTEKSEKDSPREQLGENQRGRGMIWKDLLVDGCDLVIPAVTVGWIDMDPALLGGFIVVSTIGAGVDIWKECQT